MYYILYEGLKIDSNEPVYCTLYNIKYSIRRQLYHLLVYYPDLFL